MADRAFERMFAEASAREAAAEVRLCPSSSFIKPRPRCAESGGLHADFGIACAPTQLSSAASQCLVRMSMQAEYERRRPNKKSAIEDEEAALRKAADPMTVADAIKRILLAWRDRDYFRWEASDQVCMPLGKRYWWWWQTPSSASAGI